MPLDQDPNASWPAALRSPRKYPGAGRRSWPRGSPTGPQRIQRPPPEMHLRTYHPPGSPRSLVTGFGLAPQNHTVPPSSQSSHDFLKDLRARWGRTHFGPSDAPPAARVSPSNPPGATLAEALAEWRHVLERLESMAEQEDRERFRHGIGTPESSGRSSPGSARFPRFDAGPVRGVGAIRRLFDDHPSRRVPMASSESSPSSGSAWQWPDATGEPGQRRRRTIGRRARRRRVARREERICR